MPNLKNRFMDQVLRVIRRHLRLEVCAVDQVHWHKEPGDLEFNEVTVVMRDRAKEIDANKKYIRIRIPVLQNLLGGHCGGYNWNPRKGDLVYCFFYHERKGVCLGNFWGWHEYPNCRPSPYDIADKNGQWMAPYQNPATGDFPRQPYPALEKPYCFRWFHGPVKGSTGKGRDWMLLFDYCHEGHTVKDCHDCKTIDSVNRASNHGFKFYSTETESEKSHPERGIYFTPGGSYWMFESKCCGDCDHCTETTCCSELFTEGKGFWTVQGAVDTSLKGHIRHSPLGTIDIHSKSESASIAAEATGTRVVAVSPDDQSVDYAVQAKDFMTAAFKAILKTGKIHDSSPSEIKLQAPDIVLDGDVSITGSCTHGSCSCDGEFAKLDGEAGGQTVCGGTEEDEELTLCGTSDASKGCVTVDADLECTGDLQTQIKAAIKTYCDTLYPASAGKSGGQTVCGGTGSGDNLSLVSTSHGTKGLIGLGSNAAYDQANDRLGIGTQAPSTDLHIEKSANTLMRAQLINTNTDAAAQASMALKAGGYEWVFYVMKGGGDYLNLYSTTAGAAVMNFSAGGDLWVVGDVSADNFVDHTPGYAGDALAELKNVVNDAQGRISHKTLPAPARAKLTDPATGQEIEGRSIGGMVSVLTKAVQQLTEKLEAAEKKIAELEAKV